MPSNGLTDVILALLHAVAAHATAVVVAMEDGTTAARSSP
jgi:hypothetical protein